MKFSSCLLGLSLTNSKKMWQCKSVCLSIFRVPVGLEDVSTYPKLVEELLRRGYSDEEASKVVGKNLITAMEKMEQVNSGLFKTKSQNCREFCLYMVRTSLLCETDTGGEL